MATHEHKQEQTLVGLTRRRLTRREMLKLSGTLVAGGLLASCRPAATPTEAPTQAPVAEVSTEAPTEAPTQAPPAPVGGTVVVMHGRAQFSEEQEAQFEADNPGIEIEFLNADPTRFLAMYAAGNPPDLIRTQAPAIPQYVARGMLYDLTPYFEASEVLNVEDLAPANNYYRANGPLEIGDGPIYGMVKDWSPDFTIFVYTQAFEDAGLDVPDDTTPLTYQEIADLAQQLAVFEGDRTVMFGYGYHNSWEDRIWMNMLGELDQSLYADDFTRIDLTGNDAMREVLKYYFDLASANLTFNPLNPSANWPGMDFTAGAAAMVQYGYWFSAMAESDVTAGKVVMLPAPTWAGVRRDPTMTATGMVMAAATKVPDAAWKVFEWYNGKEPAIARAKSGWGVPALKSLYDLMPTETEYQQQVQRILQAELTLDTPALQFNPFLEEGAVVTSWGGHLEQALLGTTTFDELLANVEAEVNLAIQEGIDRIF